VAVTIRLARTGSKNRPSYRLVASEHSRPRDGRFLEILGHYNARQTPEVLVLDQERVKYWISNGAMTSKMAETLIKRTIPGYIEALQKNRTEKIKSARRKRKARSGKSGSGKAAKKK
jgi:small subunit ribosomal protein S16